MKIILFTALIAALTSCSDFSSQSEEKKQSLRIKKISSSRKVIESRKSTPRNEISGTLSNGTLYEATQDEDGYIISFDPFIARKDEIFTKITNQIISKIYSDRINDESHISIESNIDYTIYKGAKARYKIVPFIESSGEISSITITSMM